MIKCSKCGAIFGKMVDSCFYCGGVGTVEEVDNSAVVEEEDKTPQDTQQDTPQVEETKETKEEVVEETPKKRRGRKKKSE